MHMLVCPCTAVDPETVEQVPNKITYRVERDVNLFLKKYIIKLPTKHISLPLLMACMGGGATCEMRAHA